LVVAAASALIELAQGLVPTRTVSSRDILLNVAGIAIGLALVVAARVIRRWLRTRAAGEGDI
jgi:VanZ family protein